MIKINIKWKNIYKYFIKNEYTKNRKLRNEKNQH